MNINALHECFKKLFLLLVVIDSVNWVISSNTLTQEEWHQLRFGGDASHWALKSGGDAHVESQSSEDDTEMANIETNVQSVDVGRDKLVLVNDEGTIKMLKASQLPNAPKPESMLTVSTTTPPTIMLQSPDNHYYSEKAGSNNHQSANSVDYISANYGNGNRVSGLPLAFATSKTRGDNYQSNDGDCPCRQNSQYQSMPRIFLPASDDIKTVEGNAGEKRNNMVRITIEMPERLTRNVDEASRYAATQIKKLIVPNLILHNQRLNKNTAPNSRKVKNVQEIIRKVVHLEDEDEEDRDSDTDGDKNDEDLLSDNLSDNKYVRYRRRDHNDDNKNIVIVRKKIIKSQRPRRNNIRGIDRYRKLIKVY